MSNKQAIAAIILLAYIAITVTRIEYKLWSKDYDEKQRKG